MNGPVSLSLLASRNSPSKINLFEAPAYTIGKLSFQQLLQRPVNLSHCENDFFSLKFPSLTSMMIRMPFLYVQVCNHNVRLTVR